MLIMSTYPINNSLLNATPQPQYKLVLVYVASDFSN